MTTASEHIIRLIDAEIMVSDRDILSPDHVISLLKKAVENMGDSWNRQYGDTHYRIKNLELELEIDASDISRLDKIISRELENVINDKIQKLNKYDTSSVGKETYSANSPKPDAADIDAVGLTVQERKEELFLYFLEYGRFPWWAGKEVGWWVGKETGSLSGNLLNEIPQQEWKTLLHKILNIGPVAIKRLTRQFSEELIQDIIRKSVPRADFPIEQIFELIEKLTQTDKNPEKFAFYEVVFNGLIQDESVESLTRELMDLIKREEQNEKSDEFPNELPVELDNEILKNKEVEDKKEVTEVEQEIDFEEDLNEDLTVNHAGVVLLHPFLNALFTNLDWVKEKKFINNEAKERAVCLLYYLATGMEEFPENELTLFKFLCNIPLGLPVDRYLKLSDREKEEAENVLKSAIQHWSVLKNTSVEGLRYSFLQRDGILKKTEFGYTLFVKRTAIDILLDKLPWNLSLVKLPWMNKMLTVSW